MGFFYIMHGAICVLLVATILFQDGKTGGLVSVADSSQAMFGARGASKFLTKLTSVLAVIFMILSLTLAYKSSPSNESIASDYVPPTPAQGSGAVNAPAPANSPIEGATVEVVDPETGEKKIIPLSEAVKDIEVIENPEDLPDFMKEQEAQKQAAENTGGEAAKPAQPEAKEGENQGQNNQDTKPDETKKPEKKDNE